MLTKTWHLFGTRFVFVLILVMGMVGAKPAKPALAATFTVTNINDIGPGSLRDAIFNASAGDTITFDSSLAGQTIPLSSQLTINKDLTIDGSGLSPQVVLSGENASRIMEITFLASNVTISDLTLTKGFSADQGGAIYMNSNTQLTLKNSTLYQNQSSSAGGAIAISGNGAITIINSTFYQNQAGGLGGAISLGGLGPVTIVHSTFVSNGATGNGGAVAGQNITLTDSTLSKNTAGGDGGAIYSSGSIIIRNTTIDRNQATLDSGAISIAGNGSSTIVNSTVFQNQAGDEGGAIKSQGNTTFQISNSTFAGNTAANGKEVMLFGTTSLDLHNTIFVCTTGSNHDSCYTQFLSAAIFTDHSILGVGVLNDYGLAELADNGGPTQTMALLPESPFIDAGNDSICANSPVNNLDQRGVTRPQGIHCDIGAFETQDATRPAVISFDPENEALNIPVDKTITVTFSEDINPATVNDSSIFLTPFYSNTHIPVVVSSVGNVVTLTPNDPLEAETTFLVQVTGAVEDLAGNALNQVWLSLFTTGPNGVRDTTAIDFAAGTLGACYLSNIENGEVTLSPLIGEEFSGTGLPANWSQLFLNSGTITVSNDAISADGAMAYYSNGTFTADHRLKFVGTFSAGQSQRVGLVGNTDFSGQWAAFSTNNTPDKLYAVTSDGQNTLIPGDFIGTKHTYEIIWLANAVHFYVDNLPTAFATHTVTLTNLRPMLSDSSLDGQSVTVEWMHFTPYSSPCTFVSRVFDAGKIVDWLNLASWTGGSQGIACIAALPPGPPLCTPNYGFTIETRTGNTATPNGTWSAWQAAGSSIVSPNGRYMQYRATLSSDAPGATQQLFSVVATYLKPPPAIYRVETNGASDPSCGASWSNPCDLQYALTTLVGSGDEVWVKAGVYKPGNDRTASFVLRDGVAVYGGFAGTEMSLSQRNYQANVTVLSGDIGAAGDNSDNSYHVVVGSGTDNSAILDGFTITGGKAQDSISAAPDNQGGGMYTKNGSPNVANVIFTGNAAAFGGGMYNGGDFLVPESGGHPILTNVRFLNNSAFEGGGIFNENYIHVTLNRVIFDSNTAIRAGGGLEDRLGTLTLMDVTFNNNTAGLAAGGMQNFSMQATLTNVTFSNNSAAMYGGGLVNADVAADLDPKLTNVTFYGNSAAFGGGMWNHETSPLFTNVTFSGNSASTSGGGIYNESNSNVTMRNAVLWGNTAPTGAQIYNDNTSASLVDHSVVQSGHQGIGNMDQDPRLGPLQDNGGFTQTMALRAGSPAINTAEDANCPATDQRGVTRPQGRHCDMGAYEYKKKHGNDTTGVFRPSNGLLYLKNSNTTGFADVAINYGLGGDYPVVGDWDGNGTATIGIYRNGIFYLRNSNTVGFADLVFAFGIRGDQPIAGDWDGDGIDTIGVYRPSNGQFLLRNSNDAGAAEMSFYLGNVGDVGIAGDWDGDGLDTTGVFRPSNGIIFLKNTNETGFADVALNYGIPGDKPVIGDWNEDGIDTIGVYRNGTFYLRNTNTVGFADIVFDLGIPGDMPIAGNWDNLP